MLYKTEIKNITNFQVKPINKHFTSIISSLIRSKDDKNSFSVFDPIKQFDEEYTGKAGIAQALNAAFLIILGDSRYSSPVFKRAKAFLKRLADIPEWKDISGFYTNGITLIHKEIETVCKNDPSFAECLKNLSKWVSNKDNLCNREETIEKIWSVFFPEATGIRGNEQKRINDLRKKRILTITELNSTPITNPVQQILFTSNTLFTIPSALKPLEELDLSNHLKKKLIHATREPQLYWYDHPTPVGVKPGENEVLHGLRGLDTAVEFERARGNAPANLKLTCVLSVSVTHRSLQDIAKKYLEEEFKKVGGLKNINLYLFTESDTQQIINGILVPAARHYLGYNNSKEIFNMFGVDGQYGRHYSFLKAISAFWHIYIQPEIKATFKIDLDQVFPEKQLIKESGASAFEHFTTPLWGAHGLDINGHPVELGMIAGALVNKRDINKSLFTPDVKFPNRALHPDEYIFFSMLPQALSTEAEMMTRYTTKKLDGKKTCIQRFHITGGTNGILVDSLRRHRPFTPSFIGRAEDQAYIFSVLTNA
ncbi:MAG: hypothetical protein U9Q21_03035, partial [Candidatus Auribacterota bacterium]|nr:hypothetical protein [Candidatus Auribacterota bacterium]